MVLSMYELNLLSTNYMYNLLDFIFSLSTSAEFTHR
jgi:hypothetical protein